MSDWEHQCIALFDGNKWAGEGNFCGYYAAEYYLDTTILAYGIQLRKGCTIYNPKAPFDGGFFENVNAHFDKVPIGSALWEVKIEADSVEEAVRIFKSQRRCHENYQRFSGKRSSGRKEIFVKSNDSVIVSWDLSNGQDMSILLVGRVERGAYEETCYTESKRQEDLKGAFIYV